MLSSVHMMTKYRYVRAGNVYQSSIKTTSNLADEASIALEEHFQVFENSDKAILNPLGYLKISAKLSNGMDTQIHQGKSVTLKKCTYTGYCASIWSVENAIQILDQIGLTSDSEDCLPFAIRLVEGGELVQIAEDNGEFGCGDVLAECLSKVDKYNVLVCVSRRIRDSCVLDMHQRMKLIVVKEAGMNAVNVIHAHLSNQEKVRERSEMMKMPVDIPEPPTSSRPAEDRPAFESASRAFAI